MFDLENADTIAKFNAISGILHRSKPYDLTDPKDLKQAFLLTVAACMDYRRYWLQLSKIEEETDESIEHYDTATWLNMSLAPEKTDSLVMDAIGALNETSELFREVAERAEKNCAVILKAILSSPPETQKSVLGRAYQIPKKELDARIAELFEGLLEVELHYNMQENRDEFLALMKNMWGNDSAG